MIKVSEAIKFVESANIKLYVGRNYKVTNSDKYIYRIISIEENSVTYKVKADFEPKIRFRVIAKNGFIGIKMKEVLEKIDWSKS